MNFIEFGFAMLAPTKPEAPFHEIGEKLRAVREEKGLSRKDIAQHLRVHVSSVFGWEAGKRLPRDKQRLQIARMLGCEIGELFPGLRPNSAPETAALVDTKEALPDLLMDLTRRARTTIRALRLAAPYTTTAYVQTEWRKEISQRVLDGSIEIQRVEIFYDLRRLQEVLSNILRYDGHRYYVKSFCVGITEVSPSLGGYFFDDDEFLLGAYWTSLPPINRLGIRFSGPACRAFFNDYWDEIWRRGTWLNSQGSHDLSAIKAAAEKLGLPPSEWKKYLQEAKELRVGDGAPPLI